MTQQDTQTQGLIALAIMWEYPVSLQAGTRTDVLSSAEILLILYCQKIREESMLLAMWQVKEKEQEFIAESESVCKSL